LKYLFHVFLSSNGKQGLAFILKNKSNETNDV
jgi:hypothetical protein